MQFQRNAFLLRIVVEMQNVAPMVHIHIHPWETSLYGINLRNSKIIKGIGLIVVHFIQNLVERIKFTLTAQNYLCDFRRQAGSIPSLTSNLSKSLSVVWLSKQALTVKKHKQTSAGRNKTSKNFKCGHTCCIFLSTTEYN